MNKKIKRVISLQLVVLMLFNVFSIEKNLNLKGELPIAKASDVINYGDVNGDGEISILDLIMFKSRLVENNISGFSNNPADLNDDGEISSLDAAELAMFLLNAVKTFSYEGRIDTDSDGLCDYIENNIVFTKPDIGDSDGDGLNDYEEIYLCGTDPMKPDTDIKKLKDIDEDGLGKKKENIAGNKSKKKDTDDDGLSDFEELNKYKTKPLKNDTDSDKISDGGEIILGIDPLNSATKGTSDSSKMFKQTLKTDNCFLQEINNANSKAYSLSVSATASGYIEDEMNISVSKYSEFLKNDAVFGDIIDVGYSDEFKLDKMTLEFKVNDNNLKNYCVFGYFEDINMLMPLETSYDNGLVSVNDVECGTYCIVDIRKWYDTSVSNCSNSLENVGSSSTDKVHILFAIDCHLASNDCDIANEVYKASKKIFNNCEGKVTVEICTFSYIPLLRTVQLDSSGDLTSDADVEEWFEWYSVYYGSYTNSLSSMFIPLEQAETSYSKKNYDYNYVFTFAASTYTEIAYYDNSLLTDLENIKQFHASYIIPSKTGEESKSYFTNLAHTYHGNVYIASNTVDEDIYQGFKKYDRIEDPSSDEIYRFLNTSYKQKINKNWKDAADGIIPPEDLKTYNFPDTDYDGEYDYTEINFDYVSFDENGNAVYPTFNDLANKSEKSKIGVAWFKNHGKEIGIDLDDLLNSNVLVIYSYPDETDSDGDGRIDPRDACPNKAFDIAFEIKDKLNASPDELVPERCVEQMKKRPYFSKEGSIPVLSLWGFMEQGTYFAMVTGRMCGFKYAPELLFTYLNGNSYLETYPLDNYEDILANTHAQRNSYYRQINRFMTCVEEILVVDDHLFLANTINSNMEGTNFSCAIMDNPVDGKYCFNKLDYDCFIAMGGGSENVITSSVTCSKDGIYEATLKYYMFDAYNWDVEPVLVQLQEYGAGAPFYSYGCCEMKLTWSKNSRYPETKDGFDTNLFITDFRPVGIDYNAFFIENSRQIDNASIDDAVNFQNMNYFNYYRMKIEEAITNNGE